MKKLGFILVIIGVLFVMNAIFGRYAVLPGYIESLEAGASAAGSIPANVAAWKVARYLLWVYSFKLGIFFVVLGALLRNAVEKRIMAVYTVGGLMYISFAYMPLPGPSLLYGIGGGIMTIAIIVVIMQLANERGQSDKSSTLSSDLRIGGYFFLAMATYNLCPLLGVRCFALSPRRKIEYGLQSDANSFAAHILLELSLAWCFLLASHIANRKAKAAGA